MRRRADAAGWLRHALPAEYGGHDATNLEMAIIREHLATKGLGLHNDLQNESLDRRQLPDGADDARLRHGRADRPSGCPASSTARAGSRSGSPSRTTAATRPTSRRPPCATATSGCINGMKRFNCGLHHATHDIIFARTSGEPGDAEGHHRVPRADRRTGLQGRLLLVDVQHADRPRRGLADRRACRPRRGVRDRRPRARARAALRAREPDPPGRVVARRGAVLHQRSGRLREQSDHVGQAAVARTRRSSSRSSSCTPRPRCCAS